MNVMTSLILAFTLGLGIAHLNTTALKDVCNDFKDIIIKTIQVIILPLLPIYIFGIFLNMTHSGQVMNVLSVFIKIIGVIFLLHISCSFPILHCGSVCPPQSVSFVGENASGLFHCVGHTVVGSHHSCHPATKHQERSE